MSHSDLATARRAYGFAAVILFLAGGAHAQPGPVLTGPAAFGDWTADRPGVTRKISPSDMPAPNMDESVRVYPRVADETAGARPQVPAGFTIAPFGEPLEGPRALSVAPNGDVFVSETVLGRIRVIRPAANGAAPASAEIFAEDLDAPFGVAFYPATDPRWVYVAEMNAVKRFAYRAGDMKASGTPEVVIAPLAASTGGHTTRDIAFSADGRRMLVAIGSSSNVPRATPKPQNLDALERDNGLGAIWGGDAGRAVVLSFTPEGKDRRPFASGIRNCVDLERNPQTGDLYCTVNERDGLGDNLVPDYVTRVKEGAFYGWPWYYITGDHEDPRLAGQRPDLKNKVTVPDVLFQSHAAPLGAAFYPGRASGKSAFPADYGGDLFVALHGSQNRSLRIGHTIVRVKLKDGVPTGEYQDFVTGMVIDNDAVLGRPTGIAVLNDGSLLFSDDVGGQLWRVAYTGQGDGGAVRTDRDGQIGASTASAPDGRAGPLAVTASTAPDIGSPVQVTAPALVAGAANTVTLRNSSDAASLPAARFRWAWLTFPGPGAGTTEAEVLSSGEIQGPAVPPNGMGALSLPASAAGRDADALRLIALDGDGNGPTWVWPTKVEAPAPRRRVGAPTVQTEGSVIRLAAGTLVQVDFDAATGLLRQITRDGRVQTLSGGKLVMARPVSGPPAGAAAPIRITTGSGVEAGTGRATAWLETANAGGLATARWSLRDDGDLILEYSYAIDGPTPYHGVGFDQPAGVKTVRALVRAPTLGVYDLAGTEPGMPTPRTAGYFAEPQWVRLTSERGALDVTIEGAAFLQVGARPADFPATPEAFPATTLGFMHAIPSMSGKAEQTGSQARPGQASGIYAGTLRFRF